MALSYILAEDGQTVLAESALGIETEDSAAGADTSISEESHYIPPPMLLTSTVTVFG